MLTTSVGGPVPPGLCQAPPARTASTVLAPRVRVAWSLDFREGLTSKKQMAGEDVVGPSGMLEIGPYGSVLVGGMTPIQAQAAVERHLAKFLIAPHVRLTITGIGAASPDQRLVAQAQERLVPIPAGSPPEVAVESSIPAVAVPTPSAEVPLPCAPTITVSFEPPLETPTPAPVLAPVDAEQTAMTPCPAVCAADWRPAERVGDSHAASGWRSTARLGAPRRSNIQLTNWQGEGKEPAIENIPSQPRPLPRGPGDMSGITFIGDGMGGHPIDGPGVPHECNYHSLPLYVVEPPDILLIQVFATGGAFKVQPIQGQHLVRPDGYISLGIFGDVKVAGMNMEQVKMAIYGYLTTASPRKVSTDALKPEDIAVDVLAYNSKYYYVITDGGGYGEQVQRFPITGKETVLDAISQIQGLPPVASKCRIWVARTPCAPNGTGHDQVYPVDWCGVAREGHVDSNYQLMPGDRVYVDSQAIIKIDSTLAKIISPIERVFGITLLGATTVNTLQGRGINGGGVGR
jgi:polysaccharide export outer membrane protein